MSTEYCEFVLLQHVGMGIGLLYRVGGTCWELQTQPLNFNSLYFFPTSPSVLHHCRARTLEFANSRTVDSRTLELSILDLSNCCIPLLSAHESLASLTVLFLLSFTHSKSRVSLVLSLWLCSFCSRSLLVISYLVLFRENLRF
jgi:hypothetical protein